MKTRIGFALLLGLTLAVAACLSLPELLRASSEWIAGAPRIGATAVALAAAGVALQLVGHLVRSEKHTVLLREIRPIGRIQVFRGQMIGFMFNALLPLRVGEVMRAHYVGRAVEISRSAVLATIVLERCVDLVVVSLVGGAVLALAAGGTVPVLAAVVLSLSLAIVLGALLVVCWRQPQWFLVGIFRVTGAFNDRLRDRLRHVVWSFCHALHYALPSRRVVARYGALTTVMWAAYLGSLAAVCGALTSAVRPPVALATAVVPYLGMTSWRATSDLPLFRGSTVAALAHWLPTAGPDFAVAAWAVLVIPSVLLGAAGLLHGQLVQHVDGAARGAGALNKLFRDEDPSVEFSHMLAAHFRGERIGRIVSREEAKGGFSVVRALKGGSHASTLLVWQRGTLVVKKIVLPEHASKLESQYDWLAARGDRPQVVGVLGRRRAHDHCSIDIEFREGYVSFFEQLHASSPDDAWSTLERVLDFVDAQIHFTRAVTDNAAILDEYIASKVVGKIRDAAEGSVEIGRLAQAPTIVVNGERLMNIGPVLERIVAEPRAMDDLRTFGQGVIHGDLTIDNLMVHPVSGDFMLIDPNDENAIADPVVDYAKLMQSLHSGYEFLLMHDVARVDGDRVSFEERKSAHYQFLQERCLTRLADILDGPRMRSLLFHEAVHYCRMLTYRVAANPDSAAMYYGIAVRLLNRFVAQYDHVVVGEQNGFAAETIRALAAH